MDIYKVNKFSWVLTDLIIDLGTTSKFYSDCYQIPKFDPFNNKFHLGMLRMCHMNAIISLSKLGEALVGYASELKLCCSDELVKKTWKHKEKIEDKNIYEFRSKYVAHVFDKDTKEPLDLEAGYDRLIKIVGANSNETQSFYDWISNIGEPSDDLMSHLIEINSSLEKQLDNSNNQRD